MDAVPLVDSPAEQILGRLEARVQAIAARTLERYHDDIPDYRPLGPAAQNDIRTVASRAVDDLLTVIRSAQPLAAPELAHYRNSAERRVYQGVSIAALLRAYRIWQEVVWSEILAASTTAEEREAALRMAGALMAHVNLVSTVVADAYFEERTGIAGDREMVRRDLLEALIAGRSSTVELARLSSTLRFDPTEDHVVVLVRATDPLSTPRAAMRDALAAARDELSRNGRAALVGVREAEVVAIAAVPNVGAMATLRERAQELASRLDRFDVGIGRSHRGAESVSESYGEAQQAVDIAAASTTVGKAVAFEDVLVDHILRSSPYATSLVRETIGRLRTYDATKKAALEDTLRAYFKSGFSLTRSAAELHVHPNTVVYRLARIADLCGRDPTKPDDLLVLIMGLKVSEHE